MLIKVNKSFNKLLIMHFAGTGFKAGTILIRLIVKQLIMHFADSGSELGKVFY